MDTKIPNYGLNLQKERADQDPRDWEFELGVSLACLSDKLKKSLNTYLPKGEVQKSDYADMMDCTNRAVNNDLETKLTGLLKEGILGGETVRFLNEYDFIT